MLVEIILASAIAMGIAYFITDLTIKLKNKNDDLLVKTLSSPVPEISNINILFSTLFFKLIYIKDLFPHEDRGTELFLDIFGKDEILEKIYFDYNQLNKKSIRVL